MRLKIVCLIGFVALSLSGLQAQSISSLLTTSKIWIVESNPIDSVKVTRLRTLDIEENQNK